MNCRRVRTLIYDVNDNAVDDRDRIALEQHLVRCPSCESLAKRWSASLDLLRRVPVAEPDDNFNWKVRLALAQARKGMGADTTSERTWMRSWNLRFGFGALSTFAVVAATGYVLIRTNGFAGADRLAMRPATTIADASRTLPKRDTSVRKDSPSSTIRGSSGVSSALVSTGQGRTPAGESPGDSGLIDEVSLNTDSLTAHYLNSQYEQRRMRQLELQVETLVGELRKCERQRE
jgi:hypothetical protein